MHGAQVNFRVQKCVSTFEFSFSSDNIFCCGEQRDKYWDISNQGKVNVYSVSNIHYALSINAADNL